MLKAEYSSYVMPIGSVSAEGDIVTVPDAHLLFTGAYSRTAHDLIISDSDGSRFVISGYFDQAEPPALASPEGAVLSPDVVTALAGPLTPGQYAQNGGQGSGEVIGKVTALTGTATAQHTDGTVVQLQVGDPVLKGDVLQTGPDSSVGLVFTDQTVFSLSASARMVLNELVYQPGGSDNSIAFSLVEGTFTFVAGQVAPTGEMKINTPVASMGIRGTTLFLKISATDGATFVKLLPDPGTNHIGVVSLYRLGTNELIGRVDANALALFMASASGQPETPPDTQTDSLDQQQIDRLYQNYQQWKEASSTDTNDTRHGSNENGSSATVAAAVDQAIQSMDAPAAPPISGPSTPPISDAIAAPEVQTVIPETTEASASEAAVAVAPTVATPPGPPPQSEPDTPQQPDTPAPVTGTATEGGSSSTLDALANSPGGGTVTDLPPTLPAGVTYNAGAQSFTLDPTNPAYDSLADGSTTTVTVNYQIDNGSATIPASVQWTVTGENDAPVAAADGLLSTNENTALNNIDVLGNDDDIDGDTLTISGTPTALHGTVTVNPDGTLNYTPNTGHTGPDTITYEISDGTLTDVGVVTIDVIAVNTGPTAVDDGPLALNEGAALNNIDVLGNDTDPENDTLSISGTPTALHGTVTVNPNGTLNYTPDLNYSGEDTVTYEVTDGVSTDTGTVAIVVNAVADAPELTVSDVTGSEGTEIALDLFSSLTDTDGSETLSINISGLAGATLNHGTLNPDGSYTLSVADLVGLTLTPPPNSDADITLTVTATATEGSNGDIATTTDTVLVTVDAVADAPSLTVSDASGNEDTEIALSFSSALTDTDDSETLSINISGLAGATLNHGTLNPDGSYTLSAADLEGLTLTPPANSDADITLTVTATATEVSNGDIATTTDTVLVTVGAVADAPDLTSPDVSGSEDTEIALNLSSALTDTDGSETLSINISGLAGATLNHGTLNPDGSYTLSAADLEGLTLTPPANSDADITLTVTATATEGSNGDIAITTDTVLVTVNAVADVPSLTSPDASGNENTEIALSFSSALTDTDGSETLSINISGLAGATLNHGTLNPDGSYTLSAADLEGLTLTPPPDSDADITLTVTATATEGSNGDTATTTDTVLVTVNAENAGPTAVDDGPVATNEDTPLDNIDVLGNDTDPENDTLSISGAPTALHGTVTVNPDGTLKYTPDFNYSGEDTITYEVTDGVSTDTGTVAIIVNAVADAPELNTMDASGAEDTEIALDLFSILTDTDGSETLSINISGLDGATLNHGTLNPDGSFTLSATDLVGLTLTPPANSDADITLTVTAIATEGSNGDIATTTDTVLVSVSAVADAPSLTSPDASGNEDTEIALSFSSALTDTDDSETLSINISGLDGATLNHGTLNPDGSYTLSAADLEGLTLTPPANSDADITLTVTATATEGSNGDTAIITDTVLVTVDAVADAPSLTSPDASGNEDTEIALNFSSALTDTDDSESLSINISGLAGATLNFGTLNPDGSYTLTAADLVGLTLTPPPNSDADITLTVTATVTEGANGDTAIATDTVLVTVSAVADAPSLTVSDASGGEDTEIVLNFSSALTDTDDSETLSINISGLDGATLNHGTLNPDGSYTLSAADLVGLTLTPPPDSDADITLTVTATATEASNGDVATTTETVLVSVDAVADAPSLTVSDASGDEDTEIALSFSSALTDTDGSETLSINISGLDGATLNHGTLNPDGSYTLSAADLEGLTLTPPADSDADITLTVMATATEASNGDVATTTETVLVSVDAVADAPDLTSPDASGNEDTEIPLNFSSALTDTDGSETLSINISGLAGATLNFGTLNPDGSYTLSAAELSGLTLTPPPDSDTDITLTVTVTATEASNGDIATTTDTVLVTVNAVNDAPVINDLDASTTSTEGVAAIIDSNMTISDDAFSYDGSTLTVARTGGPEAEDSFSFSSSANFTVDGSTLKNQSGDIIANFTTVGNSLVIAFTAFATAALVDDVAQHIAYANTSDTPPSSIVLDYTYSDGELSDTESITLDITAVNDGPFATPDNVITNIVPGNLIVIPEQALLANDTDPDGGGILDVNAAGGGSGGTVVHGPGSGPTGIIEVTDSIPSGTVFVYNATDGSAVGEFGTVTVSFDLDGALEGTADGDILIGADGGTMLVGHGGDDQLVGGIGRDIYVWSANDGYDTILPNGTGANEDVIKIRGSFYDYNWEVSGDDLIVGVVADDAYQWAGGNLLIKDFFTGGDSVEYLTADLGDNNGFYSPGGGDARIYLSAVTGTDQGNYFETIIGTDADDTMEGNGGAIDWFNARGGNDTMSVSDGTQGFFRAGDGDDTMTGADQDDQFIGGDGEDTIIGNAGTDEVRYDRGAGSLEPMPDGVGVTVNVGTSITLSTGGSQIEGGEAIDNWGKTDELSDIENVRGSDFDDVIVGSDAGNQLRGLRGNDILVGRDGADLYRWSLNDGYDTILADGGAPDEDVIRLDGGFYDFNWNLDGNDLVVGAAVDENGEWSDVGGNLRLKDFVLPGGDTIAYLTADLGTENNEFYSPGGGDNDARLYLSAVNGDNQGSFTELIVGTDAGETMTGGGGAADRLLGGGGNDIMSVAASTRGHFTGGDGDDQMTGGNENDVFRGGDGADQIIGGGGSDEVRYDVRADSTIPPSQGVTVNLGSTITIPGVNGGLPIAGTTAIDNWGKTDTLTSIERVRGSMMSDLLVGSNGSNRIQGMAGDDTLIGRAGADTYVWAANDGYDTILSTGGGANEDVIQIAGSFYDLNWEKDGNDLIVGAAVDDNYVWEDAGGNLRIKDFFTGTDTIAYLTGNVGANNEFYSPGGGEDARIYLSAVNGTDQGNYFEAIVGTSIGETMTGGGGAIDHLSGGGGDDIMSVDANTFGIFRGGDGEDEMTGGDMEDNFVGGAGDDTMVGGNGVDEVRYDRPGGSDPGGMTQGVVVNLGSTITVDIDGVPTLFQGFTAIDNWGDQDTLSSIESVHGSALADHLVGSDHGNEMRGMAGDDVLVGREGGDTYVWSMGDGYDTILADDGAANEDVIRLNGNFYDFNWEGDPDNPNDLLIGGAVNDEYQWADVGGNLRIKDFFTTGDTIAYIEGDFGPNNSYYNPDGSGGPTQIWLNAVDGIDQGNYSELILGTYGDDTMEGNGGAFDIMYGDAGNDTMTVSAGTRAHLRGGDGNDTMTGNDQDDALRGAAGDDTLDGGDGTDWAQYERRSGSAPFTHGAFVNLSAAAVTMDFDIDGTLVSTTVAGAHAFDNWGDTDSLSNIENVQGSDFADIVIGSDVDNEFLGGAGDDKLYGEGGENDILQGYAGDDLIDGGSGAEDATDYYNDPNGVTVNLTTGKATDGYGGTDTLVAIEHIYASFYNDLLTGNDLDNWIEARDGDDIVFGGAGRDELRGGNGDDDLYGGEDDDTLEGGAGNDLLDGGNGEDWISYFNDPDGVTVDLAAGTATDGYGDTDTLVNVESIHGSAHNDTLSGDNGDNFIEGGAGDDTLYAGDDGFDTVSYVGSPSAVSINLAAGNGNDGHGGFDTGLGSFDSVLGSHHNDTLIGNNFGNVIEGFGGDDEIRGDDIGQEAPGDMASYYSDPAGVTANLISGIVSDGYGGTDTLVDIEGIIGSAFNDTITGAGVGSWIEARDGDDTIYFPDIDGAHIDGGSGQDLLAFMFSSANATLGNFEIRGIETIDMTGTGGSNHFLELSGEDVATNGGSNAVFTSAAFADNLVIEGGSGDQVTLFGEVGDPEVFWTEGPMGVALDGTGPGNYNIYNYSDGSITASLAVDHDVAVVIAPA